MCIALYCVSLSFRNETFDFYFFQEKSKWSAEAAHSEGKVLVKAPLSHLVHLLLHIYTLLHFHPYLCSSANQKKCFNKQNLMDYVSLQHVVGLTAHDRTSKLIYHPHRTAKVPTSSTQVQVGPLYVSI